MRSVAQNERAKDLGPRGITVNVLAPGAIETDFNNARVRDNQELNVFIASQTALGRAGQVDDIGGVLSFLASKEARWVTGQRIEVSGGMFLYVNGRLLMTKEITVPNGPRIV